MPISRNYFGSWAWSFAEMIPKQQNPSRKLRPLAPTPFRKLKSFAPWPSGMQRPRELPRLTHSNGDMPSPSNTWKNKSSKRKVRISLTVFTCQAAIQANPVQLLDMLVASYHILMGQAPMSHPFTLLQGAFPTEQAPAPAAPSSPASEHSPRPKQ